MYTHTLAHLLQLLLLKIPLLEIYSIASLSFAFSITVTSIQVFTVHSINSLTKSSKNKLKKLKKITSFIHILQMYSLA